MGFLSQKVRLILAIAASSLAVFSAVALLSFGSAKKTVLNEATGRIVATRDLYKSLIEERYDTISSTLFRMSSGFDTVNAIKEFEEAAYLISPQIADAALKLRNVYLGEADETDENQGLYRQVHSKRHPEFLSLRERLGLEDIMLVEPTGGYVLYSIKKGDRFGASVIENRFRDTPAGIAVWMSLKEKDLAESRADFIALDDGGKPGRSVIAAPLIEDGQAIGAVLFEVGVEPIKKVVMRKMWKDTHIVAKVVGLDGRIIASSDHVNNVSGKSLWNEIKSVSWRKNAKGEKILEATAPLNISGLRYGLVVGISETEALAPLGDLKKSIAIALLPGALAVLLAFFAFSKATFPQLASLAEGLRGIAREGAPYAKSLPEKNREGAWALLGLFNDMNREIEGRINDLVSKNISLQRYIDTLETGIDRDTADSEQFEQTIKSGQDNELARLRAKLERALMSLEKTDKLKSRLLAVGGPEIFKKLGIAIRYTESLSRSKTKNAKEIAKVSNLLLAELLGLEKSVEKALVGFIGEEEMGRSHLAEVNLKILAEEAVKDMAGMAKKGFVSLTFSASSSDVTVHSNRELIRMAMENMIENAILFTPENGSVEVYVGNENNMGRFEVKDTGAGVERWEIKKLFDQFYQSGKEEGDRETGAGMGLYVCRVIIKNHDGKIGAESEPGKGSLFFFELPSCGGPEQESLPGF